MKLAHSIILFALINFLTTNQGIHAQGKSINIQNVFDTGQNLGHLAAHSSVGSSSELYDTWVTNAKDEWLASFEPSPKPIVLGTPYPQGLSWDIQNIELKLSIEASDLLCPEPWVKASKSVFQAGLSLARAFVIAGGSCTDCLRNEMITAGNRLIAISSQNVPSREAIRSWGEALNTSAMGMVNYGDATRAAEQNASLAGGINEIRESMDLVLPNTDLLCGTLGSISGLFDTSFGNLNLIQSGSNIRGSYDHKGGRIVGTIVGNKVTGTWTQTENSSSGKFEFTFASDGQSFSGKWTWAGNTSWNGGWNGKRIGEAGPEAPIPTLGSVAGLWKTGYGDMNLQHSGSKVWGTYDYKGGSIVGTLNGNIFKGTWLQPGNNGSGKVEFTFSEDGLTFTGKYTSGASETWYSGWSGKR